MNEVAKVKDAEVVPAPISDTGTVLSLIARAASDPNCDIDKMERLLKMHGDMEVRACEQAFNDAMGRAQEKMRPVLKDSSNTQTRSKYASYEALDRAVRPIYTKEGFSLSFDSGDGAPPEHVRVLCYVACGGYKRTYHVDMPADGKGAKGGDVMTKTHAAGSAYTYGQRYLLKMIFNLSTSDRRDDDGNAAGAVPLTNEQIDRLTKLISETKADVGRFLNWVGAESVSDITQARFADCIAMLEAKRAKAKS